MKNTVLFLFAFLFSIVAKSQETPATTEEGSIYKKMEYKVLDADKKFTISKNIVITNADGDLFWPLYKEYNSKMEELNNEFIAEYSDYIEKKDELVFSEAMDLVESMMSIDMDLLKLEKKYYKKMSNIMNPVKVAAYINFERKVQLEIRLEVIKEMSKL
ncbi:MAG: hypothetical protein KAG37_03770 [Flavobacteriales bacterium]|nr:hypothetical protein [Flavobacteriales bacterium]